MQYQEEREQETSKEGKGVVGRKKKRKDLAFGARALHRRRNSWIVGSAAGVLLVGGVVVEQMAHVGPALVAATVKSLKEDDGEGS